VLVAEPEPELVAVAAEPPAPAPARFMSEDEEMDQRVPDEEPAMAAAGRPSKDAMKAFDELFTDTAPVGPARPRFAEMEEESGYKPLPRDYATDLGNGIRPAIAEDRQAVGALFSERGEEMERDLEVPTFMRRMQF